MFEMQIIATMNIGTNGCRIIADDGQALANAMFQVAELAESCHDSDGISAVTIKDQWAMDARLRHGLRRWFESNVGPVEMESDVDALADIAWLISTDEAGRQRASVWWIGRLLSVTISEPTTTAAGWRPIRRHILSADYNYHASDYYANGGE